MAPRLVSYKLCSYAQRVAIVLHEKAIEHEIEYIDLADPPQWFLEISPFGKVPLLLISGQAIWESTAINEYLEDAYPIKLHPEDPILRAQHRAWIELANQCTASVLSLSIKESEKEFLAVLDDLHQKLDMVEASTEAGPFFSGSRFSLVDASFTPLLLRLDFLNDIRPGMMDVQRHPKIVSWLKELLKHKSVLDSCVPGMRKLYIRLLRKRRGYISGFLGNPEHGQDAQKSMY